MTPIEQIQELQRRMELSIIGQSEVVERLLLTLLCNGNALLEGLPGLAKTRAIKSLSKNLESDFSRIQFTPDLLPSDITGSEICTWLRDKGHRIPILLISGLSEEHPEIKKALKLRKTFLLQKIINRYRQSTFFFCCAPTHKATSVLKDKINYDTTSNEVLTLAKFLGLKQEYDENGNQFF